MDRQPHDYSAAAMAFAQQQQQAANIQQQQQQQQFGFHPQHQQFPPSVHGPPFIPPHPSMQPYPSQHMQQGQFHPHPPHPHLAHLQQQQQLPPAFPPHLPPHIVPSPLRGSYDSPPPAPPPSDPEVQKCIDKLVEYAAKHGPEFEAMVRENQKDNPAYSFLFGGDGHNYYRYTLWLATRPPGGPFNPPFPSASMPVMRPPNPMVNPSPPNAPQLNVPGSGRGASSSMLNAPPMHQSPFPPFYDQQNPQPFPGHIGGHVRHDYEQSRNFKGLSGPLPSDVAMELNNVLNGLTGTKESIKGAKQWFMQRSPFAPALAEALKDRVYALNDPERQLHIVYLSNDILFDSLQRRINTHDLDNEALAFKPVFGSMLARIYHNPQNKEENQSRLQKILQFWASKEVYDHETIRVLESEMMGGLVTNSFAGHPQRDFSSVSADPSTFAGIPHQVSNHNVLHWQSDKPNFPDQEHRDKQFPSLSSIPQQFLPNSGPAAGFPGAMPMLSSGQSTNLQSAPQLLPAQTTNVGEKLPPYPLFPPGLIPGMVRKMQIGSGVPYSPMSPLDIPTMIPPSTTSPSEILERVSKFFREIGEVNPSEGPMNSVESKGDDDEYERDSTVRKGGACIPPPPNLQVDPETGTLPDGSVERTPGSVSSGRLGLGATANPNEASQYDDVYSSYRKQRSTNYHTSMSARSTTAPTR